jgi:hypothetical protein
MPPREPPQTPLLTAREKESWQTHDSDVKKAQAPAFSPPSLGDKLALSLKKISTRATTEQSPRQIRSKSAVAQPEHAPNPTPLPAATTNRQDASGTFGPKVKIMAAESKAEFKPGPIWSPKEAAIELPVDDSPPADDSLKNIFGRLENIKKEVKPATPEKRPSYLGRLGRK